MMSRPFPLLVCLAPALFSLGGLIGGRLDGVCHAVEPAATAAVNSASAPLLRMTFVEPVPGQPAVPAIEIDQAGAVRISPDGRQVFEAPALSRAEMARLFDDLVRTHRILELDSRRLQFQLDDASRSSGLSAQIPGAASTLVELSWDGQAYRVECPAVGLLSRRFPQIDDLQRLAAVQGRLQNLVAVSQVGGFPAAETLAREGTAQLRQDDPRAVPLTSRDLSMVRTLPDGSQFIQFYRESRPQPTIVTLTRFPDAGRRVSVFNGASEVR